MNRLRNTTLVKLTLLFFSLMCLYNPAHAERISFDDALAKPVPPGRFSIAYVNESEVNQLISDLQRQGYTVQTGTMAQLEQLAQASDAPQMPNERGNLQSQNTLNQDCSGAGSANVSASPASDNSNKCNQGNTPAKSGSQDRNIQDAPQPMPEASGSPVPPTQPATTAQPAVSLRGDISYGSHGGGGDSASVFFLLIGVVVVAAFVVYAGKYISDLVKNENPTWWEAVLNTTYIDTGSHEHGILFGAKLATGPVSSELIQLALLGEVGNADIDLTLDENTDPQVLNFSSSYWMLGGAVRLHLTDKLVNASYLYMELLGGAMTSGSTSTIGAARLGASFGVNDFLRLGASFGAQYIGLNEDQGFANHGDNYWYTLGLEIGARF